VAEIGRPKIRCKHCPRSTWSSLDVARVEGWRMYKGVSVTGKEIDDVACPSCAGTAAPPGKPAPSWRARCRTCDWDSDEDAEEAGEGPLTARDAKYLARGHHCEPWIEISPPGTDERWLPPRMVNDDGSLVDDARVSSMLAAAAP
jgi:hypothetical protein